MANNNEITREDILALVDVKTKATNISYSDIFKTIDNIKPDNTKEFWQYFLLPLLFFVAAIVGMLFISPNSSWHRFSIIVYVLSSVAGILIFQKFEKNYWWLLLVEVLILYLVFAESLTMDGLVKLIEKVI